MKQDKFFYLLRGEEMAATFFSKFTSNTQALRADNDLWERAREIVIEIGEADSHQHVTRFLLPKMEALLRELLLLSVVPEEQNRPPADAVEIKKAS